jgi:hypothetical protein
MAATLVVNVDLGNYSSALGSAQRLSNGDYSFDSGFQGTVPNQIGQTIEVRPDGSKAYVLQVKGTEYRSFRIRTLYEGISDQLAGDSAETPPPGDDSRHGSRRDPQPAEAAGPRLADPTGSGLFGRIVAAGEGDGQDGGGATPGGLTTELPPAFRGLDIAVTQFHPGDPGRIVSPVFALNFGEASQQTLPALAGLEQAVGQIPPNPIAPVFFALEDGAATPFAGPSQDAVDQIFAGLGDGTDDPLGTF